ncbi:MAG: Coenzyme F420 hydrogenase/dehydrogenase, beta subunit C-terminal domain [Bacteroidales bacterium]|nr:Coenzyme F420 hydrogenase/dehydrogenase, beta subunit C-terminal domain [Bacteroidales bacterium]
MLTFKNKIEFNFNKCKQCGACKAICPTNAISFYQRQDGLFNVEVDYEKCIKCRKCEKDCPSNNVQIPQNYFDDFPNKRYYLGYNSDNIIRHNASSGGVARTIIVEALKHKYTGGVYTLAKKVEYPFAEGKFYTLNNIPEYDDIPNSVYHSVPLCENLNNIKDCDRIILVGTSCQLKALSPIVERKCKDVIKVCIFCKQQKNLNSTRFLTKIMDTQIPKNLKFSVKYRGEGWQGVVGINNSRITWEEAAQIPFGRRVWSVPGCNICGDPFAIGVKADISLMDPWEIRTPSDLGETLITVHSEKGEALLKSLSPELKFVEIPYNEALPALGLKDVWRRQKLVPYFKGEKVSLKIKMAGIGERIQISIIKKIVTILPKMPIFVYRVIRRIPDLRNLFIG